MPSPLRVRRLQLIQQAEGYLELAELPRLQPELSAHMAELALAKLDQLSDVELGEARVLFLRGSALRTMQQYGQAIPFLKQAARLDSENIHIWLVLGWCYKRNDQLDMAIDALEQAKEADPAEAVIFYNLACYWTLAHNKELALAYLAQALEMDENYRDLATRESDFESLRNDPDFLALTSIIV